MYIGNIYILSGCDRIGPSVIRSAKYVQISVEIPVQPLLCCNTSIGAEMFMKRIK